jgi:heme exporter protein C
MPYKTYKITAILLLIYTIIGGFLLPVPRLVVLNETIRALYFHVPMWFGMILILTASCGYSIMHLSGTAATSAILRRRLGIFNGIMLGAAALLFILKIKGFQAPLTIGLMTLFFSFTLIVFKNYTNDMIAEATAKIGLVLGILGIITGALWAKYTWGEYWSSDPKQNSAAICLLIYAAYIILRGSIAETQQRAQIAAIYNIFAYAAMIPLLFILPRMTDSLHPGNGGNPAFGNYDLNNTMRTVFYPAIIGWTLIATWIAELMIRIKQLENKTNETA